MRFASLGSGSMGNGLVFETGATQLLLDCGFRVTDTVARLARLGIAPETLSGVLVTHEHGDHADGVFPFARRFGVPVWLTHGTLAVLRAAKPQVDAGVRVTLIDASTAFAIGDALVQPYPVPHDAREPAQFVFSDGNRRLGVLTDTGCSTPHIETTLSGCNGIVLECNHDAAMLAGGDYPPSLRARIAGRYGHLDNTASAALLKNLDHSRLQHVIAAHLSLKNNTPELARAALAGAMGCSRDWIGVATQDGGFAWRTI